MSNRGSSVNDFFEFTLQPRIMYKAGLVREIGTELDTLGAKRAFIVADAGIIQAGLLGTITESIAGSIEIVGIFTAVSYTHLEYRSFLILAMLHRAPGGAG